MRNVSREEIEPTVKQLLDLLGERGFANGQLTIHFHEGVYQRIEILRVHRPRRVKPLDTDAPPGAQ
jgi:hypothetical protein